MGTLPSSGQTEKVTWCRSGTSPMPILKITLGSEPILAEISGTRPQKRAARAGLTVARVMAAMGPWLSPAGAKGFAPDQWPRTENGSRCSTQDSSARARQRLKGASCKPALAACASRQTHKIAQTPQFGRGVKPSPVPEPQSFQKSKPGTRGSTNRAAPICPKTQSRASVRSKRNRLSVTLCMAIPLLSLST